MAYMSVGGSSPPARKELLAKLKAGELLKMEDDEGRRYCITHEQYQECLRSSGREISTVVPVILRATKREDYTASYHQLGGRAPPETGDVVEGDIRKKYSRHGEAKLVITDVSLERNRIVCYITCALQLTKPVLKR